VRGAPTVPLTPLSYVQPRIVELMRPRQGLQCAPHSRRETQVTRKLLLHAMCALAAVPSVVAHAADDTGARLYLNHCAACHGADGEGGGPVAATMSVAIPNLRSLSERNGGVFPAEAVAAYVDGRELKAAHGDRQMPIWGDVFRGPEQGTAQRTVRRRVDALVAFLTTLQYR